MHRLKLLPTTDTNVTTAKVIFRVLQYRSSKLPVASRFLRDENRVARESLKRQFMA